MANTAITYQGNGVIKQFAVTFDYLARKFVRVDIDGVLQTNGVEYNFLDARTIEFVTAPTQGTLVTIRRNTSATERIVEFRDASVLKASDLDISSLQTFHIAEEAKDLVLDTIGTNEDGDLDARFRKIVNLKGAVNPNDAMNFGQYQADKEGAYQAAQAAISSATAAKASEDNSKASEDNSKASEVAASASAATAVVAAMDAQQSESDTLALKNQAQQIMDTAQGTIDQIAEVNALVNEVKGARLPVGVIVSFPEKGDYPGYLYLDGSAFDKATYTQLAAIYPTGILPDLRGVSLTSYTVYWYIKAADSVGQPEVIQAQDLVARMLALTVGLFKKADSTTVAFTKTGAFTVSTSQAITVEVNGVVQNIAASTVVTMPGSPVSGTDYAIWAKPGGTLEATSNHTSPPVANSRKIGGFHYAPGGLATGTSGGDTTPQILAGTFWDLKFRPACSDPRGMKLVANAFWADLWMLNTDPAVNGTSKYGATIADGSSPPKVPSAFGGNGTTTYPDGNWWNMAECLRAYGKRLPTYSEFAALAYGTTEATSRGTDPGTCQVDAARTSQHVFQATGNLWTWGDEFGGGAAAASWTANTGGRGSTYQMENAVRLGGGWGFPAEAGSRCSFWGSSPTVSYSDLGARGVCDHLILD